MVNCSEEPGINSRLSLICSFSRSILSLTLAVGFLLISPLWLSSPVFSQSSGMVIRPIDGHTAEVVADNQSETWLEVNLDNCDFGVPIESDGTITLSIGTSLGTIDPPFATSMDGGPFPPNLRVIAGNQTGEAKVDVIASYCPPGGIVLMGVCSAQGYDNATCMGSTTVQFIPPGESQPEGQTSTEESGPSQAESDSSSTSSSESEESIQPEEISLAELYDDLEQFLAGEGVEAPTPGQMAAAGTALVTLLAGWLVVNQMAGISAEKSIEVIQAWKDGERPPIEAEAELPPDFGDRDIGAEGEIPDKPPEPADPDETLVTKRSPVQEGNEDRLLRGIKDTQDLDDALKKTRKDFEAFEGKVPDRVKNSEAWKKNVSPQINKVNDLLKKGELDKARTWLDRAEKLIEVRKQVDRDLDHLPADQREAIVWTERTLKTLGHIGSDAYKTAVISPAKAAGEKVLPSDLAKKWNNSMDEFGSAISDTTQGVAELPRKGSRLVTHGNLQDQADQMLQDKSVGIREDGQMIKELHGPREVKVEYPDWGKSPRKVLKLYNKFKDWAFGDR